MIVAKLLYICLIFTFTNVRCEVLQLTSANISQYLQDHVTFVKFYADWCPHCRKFEPTWKEYSETKQNNDLRIAQVDCSDDPLLCSDHDIFGYPTIKLFIRGSGARYSGPRHIESLNAFYQQKMAEDFEDGVATKSAIVELTAENFNAITSKGFAFIVFFAPWCKHCKVLKPVFQELAKQMINTQGLLLATVDCTSEQNLCAKHAIKGYPTLIWFENGHEKDRYSESRELESMKRYIEQNMKDAEPVFTEAPPVQDKPEESMEKPSPHDNLLTAKTFTQGVSFEGYAFVNFGAPWCTHCQKLAPVWKQLAQKFSKNEDIRISRVDCTASESLCKDHGIRAFPTLILFRYGESKVEYNGARDFDSMYNFLVSQLEFFGDEYLLKPNNEIINN
ncbi:unnamed protein product [Adineta ricciae]|uniref:Thioredoxin domain-containing protein n=1 Tax=Adineta ricciae TaxID=249248 RepID=A0A813VJS4_ADIRI|nr:unnamed protein product [Adineta ricciae]